jgi:branched-chain amino acid transport system permease protein
LFYGPRMETFSLAIQQAVNGLIMGAMYSLMSIGMMLILGIMQVVNMAHGEFYMLGGYFCYFLTTQLGLHYLAALPVSMLLVAAVGLASEKLTVRPLVGRPWFSMFLTTFGLSMILRDLAQILWGVDPRELLSPFARKRIVLGPVFLTEHRVFIFLAGLLVIGVLYAFIKKSKIGMAMRALVRDREASALMGININAMNGFTFALGVGTAGLAGALLGALFNVFPSMGEVTLVKGFAVVIMGGMGNVQGILFSGLILGVVESLAASFISLGFSDAIAFAILIVILLFKPAGLFGKKV